MSTKNYWRGDSLPVAYVRSFTVAGTPALGDTITVTINRKVVTYTLTGVDTAVTAAAALYALYVAATFAEAKDAEATHTDGAAVLYLTATNPGTPFTATASATGTTTLTAATVTASAGPNHIDDANNWSLGHTPTAGDAVVVDGGSAMLYGLGSFTADSWEFRPGFTEAVGLPQWNSAGYYEYRTRELTINAPTVTVNCGSSVMIVKAVASSTWQVNATGNRATESFPALDIGATGNPTAINVAGGDVGFLVGDESTARTATAVSLTGDDSRLTVGRLATVTALDMDRGAAEVFGTMTAAVIGRGNYAQQDGTLTALTAYGGVIKLNHAGTVASVVCRGRGDGELAPQVDCEANNRPRTFTNSEFTGGAHLLDENKSVTLDAGGTHTADSAFFGNSQLGPRVTWNRV